MRYCRSIFAQAVSREIVWNVHMSTRGLPMITAASSPRRIAQRGCPFVSCCPKRHRVDPAWVRPDTTSLTYWSLLIVAKSRSIPRGYAGNPYVCGRAEVPRAGPAEEYVPDQS